MGLPSIQQTFDLAFQYHQAGRLKEAEPLYRQVLAQQPKHIDALHLLGVIAHEVGRHDAAVELIRQALALEPDWADAHYNLGNALKDTGQLDQAMAAWRRACALRPDYAQAYNNLGNALKEKGRLEEAVAAYRQALTVKPDLSQAYCNLSTALRLQGQADQAIVVCRQAIARNGNVPEAYGNLGDALKDKGYLDQAIAAYRQAIALKPNYPEAYNNLGNALKSQGYLDAAIAAYRQALAVAPSSLTAGNNLVYGIHFHPGFDALAIARETHRWYQQYAEPLKKYIQHPAAHSGRGHVNDPSPDRRLKIGYVSPDFRDHCQSFFTIPLFSHHDHQNFQIVCYAQVLRPDALTARIQGYADAWRNTVGLSDARLAEQIRQDQIDILVDLTLHMDGSRLLVFARKPAPVQVTWLGYPGSTGLTAIDYRLSDPYLDPPGMDESVYAEQTIRLPDSFWCYDPLHGRELPVNSLPALQKGFVTFGWLNNFCKINDDVVAAWTQVLRKVQGSRLLLLAPEGEHRRRMLDQLAKERVAPSRVDFVPRQSRDAYLQLYHRIDVSLDSFPVNGHTTSLDSLWMGVPVVSLVGQSPMGRAGWCQLSNLGLTELAGQTPEQFVQIAVNLANDLPRLRELRTTLRQRMEASPLMDAPRFARNIEAAYRQMWRKYGSSNLR